LSKVGVAKQPLAQGAESMSKITQNTLHDKMPIAQLSDSVRTFAEPVTALLPDARLQEVAHLMLQGLLTAESPIITHMARGTAHDAETITPTSKRFYRFLANERFSYRTVRKGLYHLAQHVVAAQAPAYLVIAVDPVNFEKPYTQALEGVSLVHKSTPPALNGAARITPGYPAITATIVNLKQPATTYANWFSYETPDFLSANREIERAFRLTRALFPRAKLRFVGDAGLDDQKIFAQAARVASEFVIRACHDRNVEVYNARLQRWEPEKLFDLTANIAFEFEQEVLFTHARKTRRARMGFGWLQIRLPETQQELWVIVAHDFERDHDLVLLTNVSLETADCVRQVYADWRQRGQIEHGYRFEQEEGLDVEDLRVETLERMRRLFLFVLLAAQFVCHIDRTWNAQAVRWLRLLGGKLDVPSDRAGLYILLRGIGAVWQAAATMTFALNHAFPAENSICG
jgi:hypothetical protein